MTTHDSHSGEQLSAERLILKAVQQLTGQDLAPAPLTLTDGARVDVDGVAADEAVLVEVFAHQGPLRRCLSGAAASAADLPSEQ